MTFNKKSGSPHHFLAGLAGGLVVYPAMVRRNLDEELPFMATETVRL